MCSVIVVANMCFCLGSASASTRMLLSRVEAVGAKNGDRLQSTWEQQPPISRQEQSHVPATHLNSSVRTNVHSPALGAHSPSRNRAKTRYRSNLSQRVTSQFIDA